MNFVVVADPDTPPEAYLARGLLRAHGIPALIAADNILPSAATARVPSTAVLVPPAQAEEARALLPADTVVEQPYTVDVEQPPTAATSAPTSTAATPAPTSAAATPAPVAPPDRETTPAADGGGVPAVPYVTIAAMRARRPRWVLVTVVLLLLGIATLVLATTDLLGAAHLPTSSSPPIEATRSR